MKHAGNRSKAVAPSGKAKKKKKKKKNPKKQDRNMFGKSCIGKGTILFSWGGGWGVRMGGREGGGGGGRREGWLGVGGGRG